MTDVVCPASSVFAGVATPPNVLDRLAMAEAVTLLEVDATRPKSEPCPPAELPGLAGKIRYDGAGGSVRSWRCVLAPIESNMREPTPAVRLIWPPAIRSKFCILMEASGLPPSPVRLPAWPN